MVQSVRRVGYLIAREGVLNGQVALFAEQPALGLPDAAKPIQRFGNSVVAVQFRIMQLQFLIHGEMIGLFCGPGNLS